MRSQSLTTEQVLTLLAETPARIAALTADLAPAQLHTPPNHDEWSANDVLAHLRACADVWGNQRSTSPGKSTRITSKGRSCRSNCQQVARQRGDEQHFDRRVAFEKRWLKAAAENRE